MNIADRVSGIFGAATRQISRFFCSDEMLSGSTSPKNRNSRFVESWRTKKAVHGYGMPSFCPWLMGIIRTDMSCATEVYTSSGDSLLPCQRKPHERNAWPHGDNRRLVPGTSASFQLASLGHISPENIDATPSNVLLEPCTSLVGPCTDPADRTKPLTWSK